MVIELQHRYVSRAGLEVGRVSMPRRVTCARAALSRGACGSGHAPSCANARQKAAQLCRHFFFNQTGGDAVCGRDLGVGRAEQAAVHEDGLGGSRCPLRQSPFPQHELPALHVELTFTPRRLPIRFGDSRSHSTRCQSRRARSRSRYAESYLRRRGA